MQTMTPLLPDVLIMLAVILALTHAIVVGTPHSEHADRAQRTRRAAAVSYAIAVGASSLGALGAALLAVTDDNTHFFFSKMMVVDPFAHVMKAVIAAGFTLTLIYSRRYLEERALFRSDFYLLALFSLLGQWVMISGNHFLTLYLGLELMSLSLYALIALHHQSPLSTEAAMKYYVLGALASGFLLYGISMLYGATGALELREVFNAIVLGHSNTQVLLFGLIFIVAGVAFKLGAAPFHMWVPDVYHGAPTPVTLLIGGGPKVAAFAWGLRLLVTGLLPLAIDWQYMLVILATLSLIIGNLSAIAQKNVKRMLAYSAIAHMGFVLLGLLSGVVDGTVETAVGAYSAAMFYSIIYLLTTLGSFGILMALARPDFEADGIDDLKGLNQRHPLFAGVMLLMMFSLAGIPPTAGFYAKFAVLEALMNAGFIWLAALAVITSLFGAFYYLRIVKLMYFDAPTDCAPMIVTRCTRTALTINGCAVLALGLMPGPLMSLCARAIHQTLWS